jgi:hypothetical protein
VQPCDFIWSEHEGKRTHPYVCDPGIARTGCGAPPAHEIFWAEMTHNCHGVGPKLLAVSRRSGTLPPISLWLAGVSDDAPLVSLKIDTAMSSPEINHAEDAEDMPLKLTDDVTFCS